MKIVFLQHQVVDWRTYCDVVNMIFETLFTTAMYPALVQTMCLRCAGRYCTGISTISRRRSVRRSRSLTCGKRVIARTRPSLISSTHCASWDDWTPPSSSNRTPVCRHGSRINTSTLTYLLLLTHFLTDCCDVDCRVVLPAAVYRL